MSNTTQQLKAKQRREKFADLLREMFQLNQPELDFGLYRIMHARKDDINRFIEKDLPHITKKAFSQFSSQDKTQLEAELEKARKAAEDAGFSAEDSPKVKELQAQLKDGFDLAREEGEVYDALVSFFNRYYSEGDFLSRRVYKDGTYAIPYQGEEVVLHWANKDQYYIKSSETLRDYTFRLNPDAGSAEDPMRVHFKLVDAEADAKDNNKEAVDSKRVFVLDAEQPFELTEGEPNDQGETYTELQCRFHFRPATEADWTEKAKAKATESAGKKPPAQDAQRAIAEERLLGDEAALPEPWKTALAKAYRKSDGELADYSMLAGQLNNYTKKNTFDYFIHKDLGAFLTRELDFYIKNELLDWADIASLKNDPARLSPLLSKIEVIRSLGEKIIAFLAQLENFQKKLWLKKKFVTETHYCITLDLLEDQPSLLEEAFDNEKQLKDWEWLYKVDPKKLEKDRKSLSWKELLAKPEYRSMMVDTGNFSDDYKAKVLADIEDLEQQCDGLLVHSENFQALNLLRDCYRDKVKCIYIDPPYNTGDDGFAYKDTMRHSSWMCMMENRVRASIDLLEKDGLFFSSIDRDENRNFLPLLFSIFGEENYVEELVWQKSYGGGAKTKLINNLHEYIHVFSKESKSLPYLSSPPSEETIKYYKYKDEKFEDRGPYRLQPLNSNSNDYRENLTYPLPIPSCDPGEKEKWNEESREIREMLQNGKLALTKVAASRWSFILDDGTAWAGNKLYPPRQWQWSWERVKAALIDNAISILFRRGDWSVDYKQYRFDDNGDERGSKPGSIYIGPYTQTGTSEVRAAFGSDVAKFPKPSELIKRFVEIDYKVKNSVILDFFAGSGTTAQSVASLNRQDAGSRKFILVEMGAYFENVMKPRVIKALFSENWKDGAPLDADGLSRCLKYIRLESYEDALGNLALSRASGQQQLLSEPDESDRSEARQAYVMNYMLEVETRDSQSLLNTRQFVDPTQYKLNVRSAGGDETRRVNVDLLETFNYLLGLTVEYIAAPIYFDAELNQGEYGRWQAKVKQSESGKWWFRTVYGTNRAGQQVLVVWRNLPSVIDGTEDDIKLDNAVLDAVLIEKLAIRLTESQDDEVDVLYVNGDHNIAIPRNRKGEPMDQARIQLIEEAFHRLMFADTEQGV